MGQGMAGVPVHPSLLDGSRLRVNWRNYTYFTQILQKFTGNRGEFHSQFTLTEYNQKAGRPTSRQLAFGIRQVARPDGGPLAGNEDVGLMS